MAGKIPGCGAGPHAARGIGRKATGRRSVRKGGKPTANGLGRWCMRRVTGVDPEYGPYRDPTRGLCSSGKTCGSCGGSGLESCSRARRALRDGAWDCIQGDAGESLLALRLQPGVACNMVAIQVVRDDLLAEHGSDVEDELIGDCARRHLAEPSRMGLDQVVVELGEDAPLELANGCRRRGVEDAEEIRVVLEHAVGKREQIIEPRNILAAHADDVEAIDKPECSPLVFNRRQERVLAVGGGEIVLVDAVQVFRQVLQAYDVVASRTGERLGLEVVG